MSDMQQEQEPERNESIAESQHSALSAVERYYAAAERELLADAELETSYSQLTFRQAVQVRGKGGFVTSVLACVGLLALLGVDFSFILPISSAYGQDGTQRIPKTPYVPPLGMPLSVWVPMVIGFYLLLLVVIGISIHQGYFAEKKNAKAAAFADGFGKLALGVFLGKISGI